MKHNRTIWWNAAGVALLANVGACASPGATDTTRNLGGPPQREYYLHSAYGAGPAVFTDEGGAVIEERRIEPFGAPLGLHNVVARDLNLLNKRSDAATGWSDHGARWMVPQTGRWLTGDPPVKGPDVDQMAAPWRLHPYQYVDQNPVAYWDPDGNQPALVLPFVSKPVLGGAGAAAAGTVATGAGILAAGFGVATVAVAMTPAESAGFLPCGARESPGCDAAAMDHGIEMSRARAPLHDALKQFSKSPAQTKTFYQIYSEAMAPYRAPGRPPQGAPVEPQIPSDEEDWVRDHRTTPKPPLEPWGVPGNIRPSGSAFPHPPTIDKPMPPPRGLPPRFQPPRPPTWGER